MIRVGVITLAFSAVTFAQLVPPWKSLIDQSEAAASAGHPDRALSLAEKAWQSARDIPPGRPAYCDAAIAVAAQFERLGHSSRAEAIYEQAIAGAHDDARLERRLRISQALFLENRGKQVMAESAWTTVTGKSDTRAAETIALAFLKEKLGKLAEAEDLYRSALELPPGNPEAWPLPKPTLHFGFAHVRLPELWDARVALAGFYETYGRMEDADEVLRADPGLNYLERRVDLLVRQQKWDQAIALQKQLSSLPPAPESGTDSDFQRRRLEELLVKAAKADEAGDAQPQQKLSAEELAIPLADLEPPASLLMQEARSSLANRSFERALAGILTAADAASPDDLLFLADLPSLAAAFAREGHRDDARPIAGRYVLLNERLFGNGGRETCEAIRDCAREFASAGMAADARLMLERVEPAVLLSAGAQSPEMEDLLEIRAEILSREGSSGQSTKALREWLDLGVLLHGASSRKAAEAHMSIARHYAELGRRPEAHTSWLDAIKISRTASAGYGAEHAQVMSAASDYFAAQREFDLALACNGEALHAAAFDPDQRKKLESRRTQLLAARERQ